MGSAGAAVQKAVPNGVVGAFIEQGEEMERMLRGAGRQPEYAQLVRPLINTLPRGSGDTLPFQSVSRPACATD